MTDLHEKFVVQLKGVEVELVVVKYVVVGSRMAVHGSSSELRDSVVVGT